VSARSPIQTPILIGVGDTSKTVARLDRSRDSAPIVRLAHRAGLSQSPTTAD
jgi:hypothetical protein